MADLRVRPTKPGPDGCILDITPQSAGWRYVGFKVCQLDVGQAVSGGEPGREACLVILSGIANVTVGTETFNGVGSRMSVFDDQSPHAVYVPAGVAFEVTATTDLELSICTAPGKSGGAARWIRPDDIASETRGTGTNTRHVRNILPETETADSLLIAEVITPGGHW